MWRSLVLALGLALCLLGGEFMVVDRLILASPTDPVAGFAQSSQFGSADVGQWPIGAGKAFVPPEWAPWGLLSLGVLTVLYGATLPRGGE